MFKIEQHHTFPITILKIWGALDMDEIAHIANKLYLNNNSSISLILTDARNAHYLFNEDDFQKLAELTSKFYYPQKKIYEALVIDSPHNTALTILFNDIRRPKNHVTEIFSTEEAALKWLMKFSI